MHARGVLSNLSMALQFSEGIHQSRKSILVSGIRLLMDGACDRNVDCNVCAGDEQGCFRNDAMDGSTFFVSVAQFQCWLCGPVARTSAAHTEAHFFLPRKHFQRIIFKSWSQACPACEPDLRLEILRYYGLQYLALGHLNYLPHIISSQQLQVASKC